MLNYNIVPLSLWNHTSRTDAYLFNKISSKVVPETPYELRMRRKLSLCHLHVLGSQVEVRVYNPLEKKFYARTISDFYWISRKIKKV